MCYVLLISHILHILRLLKVHSITIELVATATAEQSSPFIINSIKYVISNESVHWISV